LQIDYAPLTVKTGCSGNCRPYAILFAPGYEPSLHPAWGRFYAEIGLLLAGFPQIVVIAAWLRVRMAGLEPTSSAAGRS